MTRVFLIHAGPTPWDAEDRLVGNHSLPLTDEAIASVSSVIDAMDPPPIAVYLPHQNEACRRAAALIAQKFSLRPRDREDLDEVRLGLWEGLTRDELRRRFPTVFEEWENHPFTVTPPEGESPDSALARVAAALRAILRRNRGKTIAIVLRPLAMQIAAGTLRFESTQTLAAHLHETLPIDTIDLSDQNLTRLEKGV